MNWYPWGEEALRRAVEEDKPILVSIGYAACHWCHVMERESFEDEATAALMNAHFINIKIDREERPDLDHIYMDAVQAMTGSGGWPLHVFLTPEKKPFFGGTYFPPKPAFNRSSWKDVLTGVHNGYTQKKDEIFSQAENLTEHLLTANAFGIKKQPGSSTDPLFSTTALQDIADALLKNADTEWGGFGQAPKFPQTFSIQYLLRQYHFEKDEASLRQALLSLDKMIDGGIFDQLGGGFARYSTDAKWLAPHFEKMLYDNALICNALCEAYQVTGKEYYANAIHHTLAFIEREMSFSPTPHPGPAVSVTTAFYSALDADSEGVEGKFYTWQKQEIVALLGEKDAAIFCDFYDIREEGNWEHTNILWVQESVEAFAERNQISAREITAVLERSAPKLMAYRSQRTRPQLDDKILLGWNALMNTAYCKAYAATGNTRYREKAIENIQFLENCLAGEEGNWFHTYKNGQAKIPAFLDDLAYLAQAYIHLQEITGEGEYLHKAKSITETVLEHFIEPATGFFFYTNQSQSDVVVRKKEVYDGATPSGNSVMAGNLLYLSVVFNKPAWREHAIDLVSSLGNAILRYPGSFGGWAIALQAIVREQPEIAIVGQQARQFLGPVCKAFIPNKIIQCLETNFTDFPLLVGKKIPQSGQEVNFYVCKNYTCREPFTKIEGLLANV